MPRWESQDGDGERMVELLVDDCDLWVARGARAPGTSEWVVRARHPHVIRFVNGRFAALAAYDKTVAALPAAAKWISDDTPVISAARAAKRNGGA